MISCGFFSSITNASDAIWFLLGVFYKCIMQVVSKFLTYPPTLKFEDGSIVQFKLVC